jgi:hypothetical protein
MPFLFSILFALTKLNIMKKMIIGCIVGGLIIFAWQFLSWAALNLHTNQQKYTPKQDTVLAFLSSQFNEDGAYYMPNVPPGTSSSEMEKQMKASEGKPWAQVFYHTSMPGMNSMFMNMARAFLVDIVIIWLLCWLLVKIPSASFTTIFTGTVFTGLITFLYGPYTMHIWYGSFDLMIHFLDVLVAWGVAGIWLGWWLRRQSNTA